MKRAWSTKAVVSVACLIPGLSVMLFFGVGMAQTSDSDGEKFSKYLFSEVHGQLVEKALASIPQSVFHSCPELVAKPARVTALTAITIGPDGLPNSGAWKEAAPVEGCGNDTVLNFYFVVGRDGAIKGTAGFPGSTHADPALQRDALRYALIGVHLRAKECSHFDVKDTRFEGHDLPFHTSFPGQDSKKQGAPWWETWTLVGCGRTFDVPLLFLPDATGTNIVQRSDKIVER